MQTWKRREPLFLNVNDSTGSNATKLLRISWQTSLSPLAHQLSLLSCFYFSKERPHTNTLLKPLRGMYSVNFSVLNTIHVLLMAINTARMKIENFCGAATAAHLFTQILARSNAKTATDAKRNDSVPFKGCTCSAKCHQLGCNAFVQLQIPDCFRNAKHIGPTC